MGMYDTIIQKAKCPNCNKLSGLDLQTKSGRKTLSNYRLGDVFHFDYNKLEQEKEMIKHHSRKKYLIWLIGSCSNCRCIIEGCAWINSKTFVIEEINLHSYKVSIKPEKIYKIRKRK